VIRGLWSYSAQRTAHSSASLSESPFVIGSLSENALLCAVRCYKDYRFHQRVPLESTGWRFQPSRSRIALMRR
jgi:hypothetical protein